MRSSYHYEERQPRDDRASMERPQSRDESGVYGPSGAGGSSHYSPRYDYQYGNANELSGTSTMSPPAKSRGYASSHFNPPGMSGPPHLPRTPRQLQSVVTTSFSVEDERDDHHGRGGHPSARRLFHHEHSFPSMERRNDIGERERSAVPERDDSYLFHGEYDNGARGKMGPNDRVQNHLQRSFSAGAPKYNGQANQNMKRSYYHHSNASEGAQLPPDFMPPKRAKVKQAPKGEVFCTPRSGNSGSEGMPPPPEWYNSRVSTWESDEDHNNRVDRAQSFPPHQLQQWKPQHPPVPEQINYQPEGHSKPGRDFPLVSTASSPDSPPGNWRSSRQQQVWPMPPHRLQGRYWDSPEGGDPRADSHRFRSEFQSSILYDRNRDTYPLPPRPSSYHGTMPESSQGPSRLKVDPMDDHDMMEGAMIRKVEHGDITLLALPQDKVALSETLCVVRENIEVFTATQEDVDAPAPGRKHAVVVGQVGLRCIHCRHTTKCTDRVKRAVCYPSSIKRIYRTVIDMKLDHFSQCKFVPDQLKQRLHQLKAVQTRSTGTTMQYFIRAAHALGMQDGKSGVQLRPGIDQPVATTIEPKDDVCDPTESNEVTAAARGLASIERSNSSSSAHTSLTSKRTDSMMSTESFESTGVHDQSNIVSLEKYYDGQVPLSLPEDKASLSPLRCFLRKQVCAFSATEEDIAVRAPTTFSITVGQVGIGCIHCVKQAAKLRSNRAVCFPFSIGRIYQSVADIQRFHFTECKMLPPDVKAEFIELQKASSKGSKGLATRQYWVTSAKKIGLVDTQHGIRFGRDPSKPEEASAFSLDILAQAAFTVTTANKQLVVPEDKETIAEFLYLVMEQLQPCRFTEADRNKRRLKDVGCIGVECKHCAGKVDSRKFFWSSVNAVESNFVSVHTHMLECQSVPQSLKDRLIELKKLRKQQTAALKTGSQKAFFSRVWRRLHDDESSTNTRSLTPVLPTPAHAPQNQAVPLITTPSVQPRPAPFAPEQMASIHPMSEVCLPDSIDREIKATTQSLHDSDSVRDAPMEVSTPMQQSTTPRHGSPEPIGELGEGSPQGEQDPSHMEQENAPEPASPEANSMVSV